MKMQQFSIFRPLTTLSLIMLMNISLAQPHLPVDSVTLAEFDFQSYWEAETLSFSLAQRTLNHLDSCQLEEADFYRKFFRSYFKSNPIDLSQQAQALKLLQLGAQLLAHENFTFQNYGDYICQELYNQLQAGYDEFTVDHQDPYIIQIQQLLADAQYLAERTLTDGEKIEKAVSEGNFRYLGERFYTRCVLDCSNGNCQSKCQIAWACIVVFALIMIGMIVLFVVKWIRRRKIDKGPEISL